jgi:hypothetical protein
MYRTYKTDADKVKVYAARVLAAEDAAGKLAPKVTEWWRRYEAQQLPDEQESEGGHQVGSPTGTEVIDSLYSALTSAEVDVKVHAVGAGTQLQEDLATAALKKEWRINHVSEQTDASVKEALVEGLGWTRVGFELVMEEQDLPRPDEDVIAEVEARIEEARSMGEDLHPMDAARMTPLLAPQEVVVESRLVVEQVPSASMLYDPTARRFQDARWHCQVTKMHPEEVKQNPVFRTYCDKSGTLKDLDALKADCYATEDMDLPKESSDSDTARITVYEMADRDTGNICTWAKSAKFLLNEAPNIFAAADNGLDWSPFVPCNLRKTSRRIRGVSEMEVMDATLQEIDLYHSELATYLERFKAKILAEEGSITEAGKEALMSQDIGAVVEYVKGLTGNVPQPMQIPQMPSEAYGMMDKLKQAVFDATGSNELTRGLFPDRRRTATETSEVVNAAQARASEKRMGYERFLEGVARRMLQVIQMFFVNEQMLKYDDWGGPVDWTWTADDVMFQYRLEVVLTPREDVDAQAERDLAQILLNTLMPLTQQVDPTTGGTVVDATALMQMVLSKFGVPRRDIAMLLHLPEEQQIQAQQAAQLQASQASAAAGVPRPDMQPGPMDPASLAAAANTGSIPPEVLLAAAGNTPVTPGAVEQVSESANAITGGG